MASTWLTTLPKQNDIPSAQGQYLQAKVELFQHSDTQEDWIKFH